METCSFARGSLPVNALSKRGFSSCPSFDLATIVGISSISKRKGITEKLRKNDTSWNVVSRQKLRDFGRKMITIVLK